VYAQLTLQKIDTEAAQADHFLVNPLRQHKPLQHVKEITNKG
jgi:hypothetical protein